MPISKRCLATGLLVLGCTSAALAQRASTEGAASAISDAVQGGTNPYRAPAAVTQDPEEAARVKCEELKEQYNATSKRRSYHSGPGTQNAQGRTIPKIERDKTRKQLQQVYRDNCT
ncbi:MULTISPECIES: hypothetical protein [Cupriavidus]|uniref:hypothetical protein n=1 Tax=Cupriavidus sp. DF5525 TaxID=3160989 RepID=UPI0003B0F192|nr:hypothetical protein N234_06235 [Ralstonia pickettii DTP0602]